MTERERQQTERQRDRETERQRDRETAIQTERQTERQRDRETETEHNEGTTAQDMPDRAFHTCHTRPCYSPYATIAILAIIGGNGIGPQVREAAREQGNTDQKQTHARLRHSGARVQGCKGGGAGRLSAHPIQRQQREASARGSGERKRAARRAKTVRIQKRKAYRRSRGNKIQQREGT